MRAPCLQEDPEGRMRKIEEAEQIRCQENVQKEELRVSWGGGETDTHPSP